MKGKDAKKGMPQVNETSETKITELFPLPGFDFRKEAKENY